MIATAFAVIASLALLVSQTPGRAADPPTPTSSAPQPSQPSQPPRRAAPVIVIDPGHSPVITAEDETTGLDVSTYENEPEMRDVWAVARLVRTELRKDGYRVIFTRDSLRQPSSLAQRAAVANRANAALALSIHDQAGRDGGIGFTRGNNIVYYQAVGKYRSTSSGKKVVFRDEDVARTSKKYGEIFAAQRRAVQGVPVRLQDDVGYDLGSRGLAAGNMWTVQLLSKVPWIYNEAGGNSPGRVGLSARDKRIYADALVRSVERSVPPPG